MDYSTVKNPLTFRIETWLGSVIVFVVAAFLVGIFWAAKKNFESESEILSATSVQIHPISIQEKFLIDEWLTKSNLGLSVKDVGYRFIVRKFPDKPWTQ